MAKTKIKQIQAETPFAKQQTRYRNTFFIVNAVRSSANEFLFLSLSFFFSYYFSEFFGTNYLEHIKLIIIFFSVFSVSLAGNEFKFFTHWISTLITIVGMYSWVRELHYTFCTENGMSSID